MFSTCISWGRLTDVTAKWTGLNSESLFSLLTHVQGSFRLGQRMWDPYSMQSFRDQADVNINMASKVAWGTPFSVSWQVFWRVAWWILWVSSRSVTLPLTYC